MTEAEQPNRQISRRELLKSIGRGGLIVSGIGLVGVSGIDLYSIEKNERLIEKNERQRTTEAEKEVESRGITKPDKIALKKSQQILKETEQNPLANRSQEAIQQAEGIVAEQERYDRAVWYASWVDKPWVDKPYSPLRTKLRDVWGVVIGTGSAAVGVAMVRDARKTQT